MMFIKTVKTSLLLLGFVIVTHPSTALSNSFASLKGNWNCEEEGVRYTLKFKTEKLLIYNGQNANYELQDNILLVEEEYGLTPYMFELQKTGLKFFSLDGFYSPLPEKGRHTNWQAH